MQTVLSTFLLFISVFIPIISAQAVWLDCDPGIDDAFAIVLLGLHPQINLIGVSSSGGNNNLETTTQNLNNIVSALNLSNIKVYKGSNQLISQTQLQTAQNVHGLDGIGGAKLQKSNRQVIQTNVFEKIADEIISYGQKVSIVIIGPQTNWCYLLRQYPKIKQNIKHIIVMGGAWGLGNITPAAQFNIFADPYSVKCVLQQKGSIPYIMIPLQVTQKAELNKDLFQFLQQYSYKNGFIKNLLKMTQFLEQNNKQQGGHGFLHDPIAAYYTLHPQNFKLVQTFIEIDLNQTSYGRTDFYSILKYPTKMANGYVATQLLDVNDFWDTLYNVITDFTKKLGHTHLRKFINQ